VSTSPIGDEDEATLVLVVIYACRPRWTTARQRGGTHTHTHAHAQAHAHADSSRQYATKKNTGPRVLRYIRGDAPTATRRSRKSLRVRKIFHFHTTPETSPCTLLPPRHGGSRGRLFALARPLGMASRNDDALRFPRGDGTSSSASRSCGPHFWTFRRFASCAA